MDAYTSQVAQEGQLEIGGSTAPWKWATTTYPWMREGRFGTRLSTNIPVEAFPSRIHLSHEVEGDETCKSCNSVVYRNEYTCSDLKFKIMNVNAGLLHKISYT